MFDRVNGDFTTGDHTSMEEEDQGTVSSVLMTTGTTVGPAPTQPPIKCKCNTSGSCDASYSTPWK